MTARGARGGVFSVGPAAAVAGPLRRRLLALLQTVPSGRVTTYDALAQALESTPVLVQSTLARLTEDERDTHPWHRVVAKGGAIGRGPQREAQFARLVREGVAVSPAGIVQDLARTATATFDAGPERQKASSSPTGSVPDGDVAGVPKGRSRGMFGRPGG